MTALPSTNPRSDDPSAPRLVRDRTMTSRRRGIALMLVSGVIAAGANLAVLNAGEPQARVLMVSGDHQAGTPVAELTTTARLLPIDNPLQLRLVTPEVLGEMAGSVTSIALDDGDLLRLGDLQTGMVDGRAAMSLPVPAARAVSGALAPGDLIDVVADLGEGADIVASSLQVLAVSRPEGSFAGADQMTVTVAVADGDVLPLARALRADSIDLVRTAANRSPDAVGRTDG